MLGDGVAFISRNTDKDDGSGIDAVDAIHYTNYPDEVGGTPLARVLYGRYNPSVDWCQQCIPSRISTKSK